MKRIISFAVVALCAHAAHAQLQTAESVRSKLTTAQMSIQQSLGATSSAASAAGFIRLTLTDINSKLLAGQPVDAFTLNKALQSASALEAQMAASSVQLSSAKDIVASASNDLASSDLNRQAVCYTLDGKGNLAVGEAADQNSANAKAHAGLKYQVSKEGCSVRPTVSVNLVVNASGSLNGVQCTVVSGKSRVYQGTAISEADAMIQAFKQCGAECGMYRLNSVTCVNL